MILARWLGVTQTTAWKMGHVTRAMMETGSEERPLLDGIAELDKKYLGGRPRYQPGVKHKRGRGTAKQ